MWTRAARGVKGGDMARLLRITVAALTALLWTSTAWAQQPSVRGYGGEGGAIQAELGAPGGGAPGGAPEGQVGVPGGGAGAAAAEPVGALPVTGLDLALLAAGALLLLALGVTLRRLNRETDSESA